MAKSLLHRKCIIPAGESFGDRRFRYKAWWCMTPAERSAASGRYPHNTPGIPDSAYAYPINKDGKLASARRTLLWSLAHTKRRVAKHRSR